MPWIIPVLLSHKENVQDFEGYRIRDRYHTKKPALNESGFFSKKFATSHFQKVQRLA
jgi:hypothetical protein